jgi:acyl carrier protein/GNAT superfamily N-acetyltransferase
MTATDIEDQVVDILRETSLLAADKAIELTDPLGELGVVDSLGLVEFVTAVEVKFQIELPETIWTDREALTLQTIIEAVVASGEKGIATVVPTPIPSTHAKPSPSELAENKLVKVASAIRERGPLRGFVWAFKRFAEWGRRLVYVRENQYLLVFDLRTTPLPSHPSSIDLQIRRATASDTPMLSNFFASFDRDMSDEFLTWRLHNGFSCFVAIHNGELVGMTWNSDEGEDNCPFTGLDFKMLPDSCYALDLYEHQSYTGKGVGLALLCFGLAAARDRGFERQVTSVDVTNTKMLTASVHLTGFRTVGSLETIWLFRRPFSKWSVGERTGRGGSVIL